MLIQNKRLRDFTADIISAVFSGINRLLPKRKNQILFYTNTGVKDNLAAVMQEVISDPAYRSYRLICSCDNTNGVPEQITPIGNLAGLFVFLRSKTVFYYNGKLPVKPSRGQTVIQLWHGIPLKKIGRMLDPSRDLDYATHYLAPSPYTGELMCKAFGCSPSKILLNGLPRCDRLFAAPSAQEACALLGRPDCVKLLAWMPTFRHSAVSDICDSNLSLTSETGLPILHDVSALARCNAALAEAHALLWIKLHPSESGFPQWTQYSNILIQSDADFCALHQEYYRILGSCDALITDYSSVYFDYLLLDRPIGFAIEDMASYQKSRGFTADHPISSMPGAILQTETDFMTFLHNVLSNQPDEYTERRAEVRTLYCGDTDRHAAKTLLRQINLKGV